MKARDLAVPKAVVTEKPIPFKMLLITKNV
jgi:hypothetical protein